MKDLELGSWDKLPHYKVIGQKTDFYIWISDKTGFSCSDWIKGRDAFKIHNKLNELFKKDKKAFVVLLKEQLKLNTKD